MKYFASSLCAVALMSAFSCSKEVAVTDYTKYVDLNIGTADHGHTFMGASVPFGMVQAGPTSLPQTWDWCSGYHKSDSTVIGFSHTHLPGTGIGDMFDITLMPVVGDVIYSRGDTIEGSGLWSYADRSQEVSRPGYYRVPLTRYGIDAELTATARAAMHRYTFPKSNDAAIVIDLDNGGCWDRPLATSIDSISPTRITGYRYSTGWADDQKVYFVADFSRPMQALTLHGDDDMYGRVHFATDDGEQLLVRVGISPTSVEGAILNLESEIPHWDFAAVEQQAHDTWSSELSKIAISAADPEVLTIFYTALAHSMMAPSVFCDVDGKYRGADGEVYVADGYEPYTVYSLWDIYRAEMPLLSIYQPERYAHMVRDMIDISQKQGRLPVWHLWGNETDCMVGNPGAIVVADAIAKRIGGFDADDAMDALLATVADPYRGGSIRNRLGFLPSDMIGESIAIDMEYAIADAAIANAARVLWGEALADSFEVRSQSYRHYFDPSVGFMRGKLSNGSWRKPFDPVASSHHIDDYCEGNAWQYTWLAPHDVEGLVACFGSKDKMLQKLDSLFIVESVQSEAAPPDITGLIGQYAHGNEPGHHIIYLYSMLGEKEKAANRLRQVMSEMYNTKPTGLCGNEDAGQMSAWYVLSALGLYQADASKPLYWFGSPIIDSAEISVPGGIFRIVAKDNSPERKVIGRATLNGEEYTLPYISYADIMKGGELIFYMQ